MFCISLFVLLSFFFWPLCCLCPFSFGHCVVSVLLSFGHCVVSVLFWFTDSDYPFGIFKLLLQENITSWKADIWYVFLLHLSPVLLLLSHVIFPFLLFLFPLLLFSPPFHVSLLSLFSWFTLFYAFFWSIYISPYPLSLSPVPPSCPSPSFPFFHSITTLSAPHMYHFHSIVFCLYLLILSNLLLK